MQPGYQLYNDEHEAFRRTVRQVVDKEIRPNARKWEEAEEFPKELYQRFGELDLLGLKYDEKWGGTNAGCLFEAVLIEELARCGSGGVSAGLGAQFTISTGPIHLYGTDDQKERFLRPAIRGDKIGALGITEPDAGSDVAGIRTTARRDGDFYVVNGSKTYITNGVRADFVVCAVKTDPTRGHKGLSMIILEKGMPGFTVSKKLKKLGWRASDTGELSFQDVRVPARNLVGVEGEGFYQIMGNFQWERLSLALGAIGGAQQVVEDTVAWVKERKAFGKTLADLQVVKHKIADMATDLECARQLTYHALRLHAGGEFAIGQTSMAKKVATEMLCRLCDTSLQLHGGAGYMQEYDIERHWRDARLGPIGGGASEIMNEIIAKQLGL
jgi:acyl-CoA dehydrogenase